MVRKDITISLNEEQINELLEIAETQKTTLSALIREIISSYFKPLTPSQQLILPVSPSSSKTESDKKTESSLEELIEKHNVSIASLESRVSDLEALLHTKRPDFIVPLKNQGVSTEEKSSVTSSMQVNGIIDSELPDDGKLSEEALVKFHRPPVLPVMDAMEMGSMKISPDRDYSQTEAAVALNVSVSTMRRYIKEKRIDARKVGRSWLVHGRDILSFLSQG
jgi:excisionase family DNA binding protein